MLFVLLCLVMVYASSSSSGNGAFDQDLPDCRKPIPPVKKVTTKTALTCAMIRDEEGFLAEWIAYHQMHGFNHIILFDHDSSDDYVKEIQPWLDSGFVSIYSKWGPILGYNPKTKKSYLEKMQMKSDLEGFCIKKAMEMKIDYFASLDLDEYLMPLEGTQTVVDTLQKYFDESGLNVVRLNKLNFQSTPHLLEPVNLLTLEAYHTRMPHPRAMTYFKDVSKKIVMQLNGYNYTDKTRNFVRKCCSIHGCKGIGKYCKPHSKELAVVLPKMKARVKDSVAIYHYSRSLEKFSMKAKTWETATGDNPLGYDMVHFLDRNVGRYNDRSALRYTCQLRKQLFDMTGEKIFFRKGSTWYRNVEFGLPMTDGEKGKRNKKPLEPGFRVMGSFHDHYFGYYTSFEKAMKTP